jgi:type I restriction enzyme, S subunit
LNRTPSPEQRSAGHPVLKIRDVSELGKFRGTFQSFVDESLASKYSQKQVRDGDTLILNAAHNADYVGSKTFHADPKVFGALATGEWLLIRPDTNKLNAGFVHHWVQSNSTRQQIKEIVNGIHLYPKDVARLKIPLPPLPEQRRIAAILDQADALRAQRREALAQLDSLAQAVFVEMFGAVTNWAEHWRLQALKHLGRVSTGGTPSGNLSGMFGGEIPFLTPGDLGSLALPKRTVTAAGAAESITVRTGATLVCCIGATIGKMDLARVQSAFNQQLNAVEWSESITDIYGFFALQALKSVIVARSTLTTLPILKKSEFERLEIAVPPIELQHLFKTRISAIDTLKSLHRAALTESTTLFTSLQHRAFNGAP